MYALKMLDEVSAVLLDMDGTLVDSAQVSDRCWASWCRRRQKDLPSVLAQSRGRKTIDAMRAIAPEIDDHELMADADAYLAEEVADTAGVLATPGAARLLDRIARLGVPHALVTSAVRELATARMAAAGLPLPSTAVYAGDVRTGKPSPEGYLLAAALLGVPPDQCVVVEDALSGVSAGVAAGARVIGIGPQVAAQSRAWATDPAGITLQQSAGTDGRWTVRITQPSTDGLP